MGRALPAAGQGGPEKLVTIARGRAAVTPLALGDATANAALHSVGPGTLPFL
jgi:hypothetical protein